MEDNGDLRSQKDQLEKIKKENSTLKQEIKRLKQAKREEFKDKNKQTTINLDITEDYEKIKQQNKEMIQEFEHLKKILNKNEEKVVQKSKQLIQKEKFIALLQQEINNKEVEIDQYKEEEIKLFSEARNVLDKYVQLKNSYKIIKEKITDSQSKYNEYYLKLKDITTKVMDEFNNIFDVLEHVEENEELENIKDKIIQFELVINKDLEHDISEIKSLHNDIYKNVNDLDANVEFHNGEINHLVSKLNMEIINGSKIVNNLIKESIENNVIFKVKRNDTNDTFKLKLGRFYKDETSNLKGQENTLSNLFQEQFNKVEQIKANIKKKRDKEIIELKNKMQQFERQIIQFQNNQIENKKNIQNKVLKDIQPFIQQSNQLLKLSLSSSNLLQQILNNKKDKINIIEVKNIKESNEYYELDLKHKEFKKQALLKGLDITKSSLEYCKFGDFNINERIEMQKETLMEVKSKLEFNKDSFNIENIGQNGNKVKSINNFNSNVTQFYYNVINNIQDKIQLDENYILKVKEQLQEIRDKEEQNNENKLAILESNIEAIQNISNQLSNFPIISIPKDDTNYPKSWCRTDEAQALFSKKIKLDNPSS